MITATGMKNKMYEWNRIEQNTIECVLTGPTKGTFQISMYIHLCINMSIYQISDCRFEMTRIEYPFIKYHTIGSWIDYRIE